MDFTPAGDTITIDFVLSSEEYPEYANSQFNDVVGVWVNGVQATVSIGTGSASIGNINADTTQNLYNDNTSDQFNTEMDGFTVAPTFVAPVNPGVINTLKIGVADSSYDTNLLIAGGLFNPQSLRKMTPSASATTTPKSSMFWTTTARPQAP